MLIVPSFVVFVVLPVVLWCCLSYLSVVDVGVVVGRVCGGGGDGVDGNGGCGDGVDGNGGGGDGGDGNGGGGDGVDGNGGGGDGVDGNGGGGDGGGGVIQEIT